MMDWYYEQLESARPFTEETLRSSRQKEFESGRQFQIGDIIFYGYLVASKKKLETARIIRFHKDEINSVYKVIRVPDRDHDIFPFLVKAN